MKGRKAYFFRKKEEKLDLLTGTCPLGLALAGPDMSKFRLSSKFASFESRNNIWGWFPYDSAWLWVEVTNKHHKTVLNQHFIWDVYRYPRNTKRKSNKNAVLVFALCLKARLEAMIVEEGFANLYDVLRLPYAKRGKTLLSGGSKKAWANLGD